MRGILSYPLLIFVASFLLLWAAAWLGVALRRHRTLADEAREDFGFVASATIGLLGLIVGFTFSMAIARYDQRKVYEEAEANAIGTELARAGLLPAADTARARALLKTYLEARIAFYTAQDDAQLRDINARTAKLQDGLWSAVQAPALAQPNAVMALAVSGMNDVLNSQGYTQAAWWNRIPHEAWALLYLIAIFCNVLLGYGARPSRNRPLLLMVLPMVVAIAFELIADIDSPRGGFIKLVPQNLTSLRQSLD